MDKINLIGGAKIRVGYAEDEKWCRDSVVELLDEQGFDVVVIGCNGWELIELSEVLEKLPDIFLTDLNMPVMDGIQATEEIIRKWPNAKVIILSSEIDSYYIEEMKKTGAVAFLHKLINYKDIKAALVQVYQTGSTLYGLF